MLVDDVQDVVVGSMIQFTDCGLLAMLLCQIQAILIVFSGQNLVFDCMNCHHPWLTIVERGRGHELTHDFVALGPAKIYWLQPHNG